jgi:hypothetical protein
VAAASFTINGCDLRSGLGLQGCLIRAAYLGARHGFGSWI